MQIDLYASIYGICEAHNLTIAMLVLIQYCALCMIVSFLFAWTFYLLLVCFMRYFCKSYF